MNGSRRLLVVSSVASVFAVFAVVAGFNVAQLDREAYVNGFVLAAAPVLTVKEDVWVVPVVAEQSGEGHLVESEELLKLANHTLGWFERASGGRVTMSAARVLSPVILPVPPVGADGFMDCSDVQDLAGEELKAAPENVIVVLLLDNEWQCDYGGLAQLEGRWAIVTGYSPSTGWYPQDKFVHEVAHTLGFGHAWASTCSVLSEDVTKTDPLSCEKDQYGDWSDPMGNIHSSSVPGFNALHLRYMGWGEGSLTVASLGRTTVFLPSVSQAGPDYLRLPNGLVVMYRGSSGREGDVDNAFAASDEYSSMEGVYLYQEGIVDDGETLMLPFSRMRVAGREGDHYVASDGSVAVKVDRVIQGAGAWLTVMVAGDQALKDVWGPVLDVKVQRGEENAYVQWKGLDPSGVKEYHVTVNGVVTVMKASDRHVKIPMTGVTKPVVVKLVAVDGVGNETTRFVWVSLYRK